MRPEELERLRGLIIDGYAHLYEAINLCMDLNEVNPGAREHGWPTLPVVAEQLSLANRVVGRLAETLPAHQHSHGGS